METNTCSNCHCELNYPLSNEFGDVLVEYNENYPVYELARGEGAVKIGAALEKIYRLSQLREINEGEELTEDVPLCSNCTNILNQMDILYQEFDRIRGMKSYLQRKIRKIDDVIGVGISGLKNKRSRESMNEDNSGRSTTPVSVTVKTEQEVNVPAPNVAQRSSGPWVVLKRLKPEEIPAKSAGPWVVLKRLKPEEIPAKYRDDIPDDTAFPVGEESDCYVEPNAEDHSEIALNFSDEEAPRSSCKRKKKLPGLIRLIKKQGDAGTSSNTLQSEIPPRTRKRKRKGMKKTEDNPGNNPPERRPKPKYLNINNHNGWKRGKKNPVDQSLTKGLNEISNIAEILHFSKNLVERATNMFKKVYRKPKLRFHSKDAVATACLYIACRQENTFRTFKELSDAAQKSKTEVGRCYRQILSTLNIELNIVTVQDFLPRFCKTLDLPLEIETAAMEIADRANKWNLEPGRSPICIAGAAIYMASQASATKKTLQQIAEVAGVSAAAIRQVYQTCMHPKAPELFHKDFEFATPIEELPWHGGSY